VIALPAGAIVDRYERRRIMLRTQALSCLFMTILATLTVAGAVNVAIVMLLSFAIGTSASFDAPARQSMLGRLVPARDMMSAVGLQSMAVHGTGIIGPALGGLLIGPIGVGGLFFANSLGYIAVMSAIRQMRPMPPAGGEEGRGVLHRVRDGVAYIASDPVVRWLFIIAATAALSARPYLNLLPAFVANHLGRGAGELSMLLSVTGVGALGGAIAVAAVSGVPWRGRLLLGAALGVGILVAILGLQSDLVGAAAASGVAGFFVLVFVGVASTILQTTTPERLLGRVMAVWTMLWMGVMPLGQLALGSLATIVGVDVVFVIGGVIAACVALAGLRFGRALLDLAAPAEPPELAIAGTTPSAAE
jgi:predicted MFS family arabinose efflux permease